ncbi:hypothetical protein TanjilG_10066 [Lupinus angustifolius]|uniref:SBP-type domain-containing protein n=1 Tax=Lupinus angustifolius TaxID=3871 RepID=A0A1J7GZ95_LUPAN|nr:PREDICTED: squamosa promoter-binding-like protein 10 [Lupinus angustifolius]XP_019424547.1 PREDICTED: squamosa promoter-binding-like protein 10 [Lupinus angustifolius]XP_019424548.1 PREDICTED: squamosa promoter-binding-like protein 10 [Lupinus angustifolius]OIV93434.1 hypothetical protein TanjilG_10066 [Lupinus angustifolius]
MDWNAKSPSQWDWEQSLFLNAKATEISKSQPNWNGETNQEINVGLMDTYGGSGCSGSELIHTSSSRSSISASNNSSSNRDSKTSMYTLESSLDDSSGKKELSKVEISHALESSSVSGEPLLSLKLGKRLYFEDVYPGSNSKSPSFSRAPMSSLGAGKKGKSSGQNVQLTRCQVEGCGLDLSSAKDYHRKHRVCESHSKSPKVVIAGMERRFCQQCSRFHDLSEFDEKKRSCRRRLTDHNARRRKPHPVAVRLNQPALSPSLYDGRQHMSPFSYSRTGTNLAWQDTHSSKLPQAKDFLLNPAKANNEMPSIGTMVSYDFNSPFISKGIATRSVNPVIEDSITSSDPNVTQDFHHALSLLSTNSWGSHEPKSISVEHPNKATATAHAMSQRLPLASPEYWHIGQQPVNSGTWISYSNCDDSNRFQEFQLFREPYESVFPYNQLD